MILSNDPMCFADYKCCGVWGGLALPTDEAGPAKIQIAKPPTMQHGSAGEMTDDELISRHSGLSKHLRKLEREVGRRLLCSMSYMKARK